MLPFEQAEEKHPGNQSHLQPGAGRRMKRVLHEEGPAPCARPGFCPCPVQLYPSHGSSFAVIDFYFVWW